MPEEWIFVLLLSRLVWPVSLIIHCVRDVFSVTRILEIRSPEVFFFSLASQGVHRKGREMCLT